MVTAEPAHHVSAGPEGCRIKGRLSTVWPLNPCCHRISVRLDHLPDGTPRLIICDNGNAHGDTMRECYTNAESLVCEKRSATSDLVGVARQGVGAGYSKNGIGCGAAVKRLVRAPLP